MLDPAPHCIGCSLWAQLMFSKFQTMRTLWGELRGRAFNPPAHQQVKHTACDVASFLYHRWAATHILVAWGGCLNVLTTLFDGMVLIMAWGELYTWHCNQARIHVELWLWISSCSFHWKQSHWKPNFLQKSLKCAHSESIGSALKVTHS